MTKAKFRFPIITLVTDFGYADSYVGEMKGVLLSLVPEARLEDISHAIAPFDIFEGALVLGQVYACFPKGTIHVAVVDPGVGGARAGMILKANGHLFIGPDNGIFTLPALEDKQCQAYHITRLSRGPSPTFHGRDIFAPVAAALARGQKPAVWGKRVRSMTLLTDVKPREISPGKWVGKITRIDHFGNLATNFPGELWRPGKKNVLLVGKQKLRDFYTTFSMGQPGRLGIIVNSQNQLEIMVPFSSAQRKLKIRKYAKIILLSENPGMKHL